MLCIIDCYCRITITTTSNAFTILEQSANYFYNTTNIITILSSSLRYEINIHEKDSLRKGLPIGVSPHSLSMTLPQQIIIFLFISPVTKLSFSIHLQHLIIDLKNVPLHVSYFIYFSTYKLQLPSSCYI